MKIAVTGGTGFIGRYLLRKLVDQGHQLRAWHRPSSDLTGFGSIASKIDWQVGQLCVAEDASRLVADCDAVVHAALDRPGKGFRASEGDLIPFCQANIIGSLQLIQSAVDAGVKRFIFISTCAVHDKILPDRPLDETHPTWTATHYGAYKAAVEQFVYSFGLGKAYAIAAVRPTGVYGENYPIEQSKWYGLVKDVVDEKPVTCQGGGKEVHAEDVANAVSLLLHADSEKIAGQVFNCCDQYISQHEVATIAKRISGSNAVIQGHVTVAKNQINTDKIQSLGMQFGGSERLEQTIQSLVRTASR